MSREFEYFWNTPVRGSAWFSRPAEKGGVTKEVIFGTLNRVSQRCSNDPKMTLADIAPLAASAPASVAANPQSAIRNPQSAIRNPQSATRNPQPATAIRNPQPAIRNPQSQSPITRLPQRVDWAVEFTSGLPAK